MVRKWRDFQYRKGIDPWHWVTTNPLFATAGLMFIALAAFIVWFVMGNLSSPRKFVTVETYQIGLGIESEGIEVEVSRVTYQPSFDIRLGQAVRARDGGSIFIDGVVRHSGEWPVVALAASPSRLAGAVGTGDEVGVAEYPARSLRAGSCPVLGPSAAVVRPGESFRFSMWLETGKGQGADWLRASLKKGVLPRIDLGYVLPGDCPEKAPSYAEGHLEGAWEIAVEERPLPAAESRDYYPFGAPTALETGINGRKYWSDWLPRTR